MVCLLRRTDLLTGGGAWIPNVTCRDSLNVRDLFPCTLVVFGFCSDLFDVLFHVVSRQVFFDDF